MISHAVEISIAGGGADEKDEEAVTLTPLIYLGNSFWWVGRPQLYYGVAHTIGFRAN